MRHLAIIMLITASFVGCKSTQEVPYSERETEHQVSINATAKMVECELEQPEITSTKIEAVEQTVEKVESNLPNDQEENDEVFDHSAFDLLLKSNVSEEGVVNYKGFLQNRKALRDYIDSLGVQLPTDEWTKHDKLTYWMNAYNAMTVDLILHNYPLESIKDIDKPWDQRLWKLGDKWYNLDEIEHQILRKMDDPRIHFGINCASFSCPPLLNEAFTSEKVDSQLDTLSKNFINDTSRNVISKNEVTISKIFNWFGKDFKTDGSLIDFLNKYSTNLIDANAKVRYKDYDWNLNN
jgi:hypothetical protein